MQITQNAAPFGNHLIIKILRCLQTWLACVGLTTLLLEEPRLLYDAFDELNWMSVFVGWLEFEDASRQHIGVIDNNLLKKTSLLFFQIYCIQSMSHIFIFKWGILNFYTRRNVPFRCPSMQIWLFYRWSLTWNKMVHRN